jgi:hypothetical protein
MFVLLQISTFCNDAKHAKKALFRIEAKQFCFRFASFCFEAKMNGAP